QATDAHRNGRDQHGQRVDQTQNADALRTGDEAVDHAQNDADDHAEQEEPPVFGAACTAVEYGVFLEDLEIPVHVFIVLLVGCPRCWLPALGGQSRHSATMLQSAFRLKWIDAAYVQQSPTVQPAQGWRYHVRPLSTARRA